MGELIVLDIARAPYEPTLQLQYRLRDRAVAAEGESSYPILVEHDPPAITLGRGADADHVLASPEMLRAAGIELHETSRGGDVTYHGPGQIVGYPILHLGRHGRDVHRYLRNIEEVVLRTLGRFGIQGQRSKGLTGVWVGNEKVAAIGVAVRRWVTCHGFALNVAPDLSHFDLIVPCGLRDKGVTSMAELLGRPIDVGQVKPTVVECMADVFGFDAVRAASREQMDEA